MTVSVRPSWRALLAAGALCAAALPASAQEVTLKFNHIWNPSAMASNNVIAPWCDQIAKASNDRMKCQIFPSMQLGGTPPQLVNQVKDGVTDLTITLPGYTPGRFPAMEVFELPFMTNSAETGARAAWDYLQKYAVDEFPGTKILAAWVHDEGYVHTRSKQVKVLADFKGQKMRAPTRQTNLLLARLGATPVGMPLPSVPEAVSKGVIDGFLLPWEVMPSLKLQEMVKYDTETDPSRPALYSAVFIFAMNQAKYDSLPADLKKIIDDNSGADLSRHIGKVWDESQAKGRQAAIDNGNVLYTVPAAELDNWEKASAPLYDQFVEDMNRRGKPGQQMLDDARALLVKYKQ